jgi:hypothetical protein
LERRKTRGRKRALLLHPRQRRSKGRAGEREKGRKEREEGGRGESMLSWGAPGSVFNAVGAE